MRISVPPGQIVRRRGLDPLAMESGPGRARDVPPRVSEPQLLQSILPSATGSLRVLPSLVAAQEPGGTVIRDPADPGPRAPRPGRSKQRRGGLRAADFRANHRRRAIPSCRQHFGR